MMKPGGKQEEAAVLPLKPAASLVNAALAQHERLHALRE